jgi:hypothetical protein
MLQTFGVIPCHMVCDVCHAACCARLVLLLQVQKSAKHYTEAAYDEVTLLKQICDGDPQDTKHCVRLLDHFEHHGPNGKHVCMVFEVSRATGAAVLGGWGGVGCEQRDAVNTRAL